VLLVTTRPLRKQVSTTVHLPVANHDGRLSGRRKYSVTRFQRAEGLGSQRPYGWAGLTGLRPGTISPRLKVMGRSSCA
jgi:hypothetical protein